ncbi:TIGR01244 family phosphatase [Alphaproteobacteria bacterium GH1-50]|uniref:TIGR01244 family phosphatase n=1 Tax=Kangsaoukella pontilimi TaxID=2691042 RepID=A0A7C9IEN6_9RHOB|nr:TIGR01244 family sulfur transferase [Kangsaoukella pontilimi]MXQ06767.1 TIGR01244 family phosphatase [Kangsaoukella pontilimi]
MIGRQLDDKVSVSSQITPADIPALAEAGIRAVICNRPDIENPLTLSAERLADAAEAAGIGFTNVPLAHGMLTLDIIAAHRDAIDAADGPVLAYCASGTRSAYLWAFAMASGDRMSTEDILSALDRAGYPAPGLGQQLDQIRAG